MPEKKRTSLGRGLSALLEEAAPPPVADAPAGGVVHLPVSEIRANADQPSLLAGIVSDEHGNRLTPSHAKKGSKRYRYYVSNGGATRDEDRALRIPAHGLESVVMDALVDWLNDQSRLVQWFGDLEARALHDCLNRAKELAKRVRLEPRVHLTQCLQRVTIWKDRIGIAVRVEAIRAIGSAANPVVEDDRIAKIEVPAQAKRCGMAVRLVVNAPGAVAKQAPDGNLIALLSKAHDWFGLLTSGRCNSVSAVASQEGVTSSYVTRVIYLAFLAPDIVQGIVRGEHPPQLTARQLIRMVPLPDRWAEQRALLGFG